MLATRSYSSTQSATRQCLGSSDGGGEQDRRAPRRKRVDDLIRTEYPEPWDAFVNVWNRAPQAAEWVSQADLAILWMRNSALDSADHAIAKRAAHHAPSRASRVLSERVFRNTRPAV